MILQDNHVPPAHTIYWLIIDTWGVESSLADIAFYIRLSKRDFSTSSSNDWTLVF